MTSFSRIRIPALTTFAAWPMPSLIAAPLLNNVEHSTTFGDTFGSTITLLFGLALGALIYAIILQKRTLALQRDEFILARQELKKSAQHQNEMCDKIAEQAEIMKVTAHLNGLSILIKLASTNLAQVQNETNPNPDEVAQLHRDFKSLTDELGSLMHAIRCAA